MATKLVDLDESCSSVLVVTPDNRVKLWDARSGALRHQFVERDHLAKGYSCVAWSPGALAAKSKRSKQAAALGLAAVGTDSGVVVVWDLAKGAVFRTLGENQGQEAHSGRVTGVCFSRDGKHLYSTSADRTVALWGIEHGKRLQTFKAGKMPAHSVAVSDDGSKLVAAGASIRVWDVSSGSKLGKVPGQAAQVVAAQFAPDNRHFVTASADRFVNVWDSQGIASGKRLSPVLVLTAPSAPRTLSVSAHGDSAIVVCCALANGTGCVWRIADVRAAASQQRKAARKAAKASGQAAAPATTRSPDSVIAVASDAEEGSGVLACRLAPAGDAGVSVGVTHGTTVQPVVDVVALDASADSDAADSDGAGALRSHVEVGGGGSGGRDVQRPGGASSGARERTLVKPDTLHVASAGDVGAVGKAKPVDARPEMAAALDADEGESRKRARAAGGEDGEGEARTLEERLRELLEEEEEEEGDGPPPQQRRKTAGQGGEDGADEAGKTSRGVSARKLKKMTPAAAVASLHTVLEQALKTRDASMLEEVLAVQDPRVVAGTARALPAGQALPFLRRLVAKFEHAPSRARALLRWVEAVVREHFAHLQSVGDVVQLLAPLYQAIETRCHLYPRVTRLEGRLSMLMTHSEKQARALEAYGGDAPVQRRRVYEESDGEEAPEEEGEDDEEALESDSEESEDEEEEEGEEEDEEEEEEHDE